MKVMCVVLTKLDIYILIQPYRSIFSTLNMHPEKYVRLLLF